MVQYVRDRGTIRGWTPGTERRVEPRSKGFMETRDADPHWRDRAECRNTNDLELFFPIGNTGPALLQIEDAKAVCHRCPVVDSCLDWALETGQDAGVWGGMSEQERASLKRRIARERQRDAARAAEVAS